MLFRSKIINIPPKKYHEGEQMSAVCAFNHGQALQIFAGKRHLNLSPAELEHYSGERAQRGRLLPRGFQNPRAIVAI